jgi:hypothetical protein
MERFITMTFLLFQTCRTGMPAIADPASREIGLTVSLAPMTMVLRRSEPRTVRWRLCSQIGLGEIVVDLFQFLDDYSEDQQSSVGKSEAYCRSQHLPRPARRCTARGSALQIAPAKHRTCPGMRPATGCTTVSPSHNLKPRAHESQSGS